jgi:hypothetical protein
MTQKISPNQCDPANYIELTQFYTSHTLKYIVKRHCEYLRERPYGTLSGRLIPIACVATGGILGFCAATYAAEKLKAEKATPILQSTGFVAGCAVGAYIYTTVNEMNLFYKTWKFLIIRSITNAIVFKNHEKDEFLNQFLDCIHYTPIKVPVRLSSGHLIDLDTLKNIRPNSNGDIVCPHTRKNLDLNNPNIDLELYTLILKRVQFLLQKDLSNLDTSSDLYNATKLQLKNVEEQLNVSHRKHLKGLEQLHSDKEITDLQLNRLRIQFYNLFGGDPVGNADPENESEAHVMDFSLDWKKILIQNNKVIFRGTPPTQFVDDI